MLHSIDLKFCNFIKKNWNFAENLTKNGISAETET